MGGTAGGSSGADRVNRRQVGAMSEYTILTPPPRRHRPVLYTVVALVVVAACAAAFVAVRHLTAPGPASSGHASGAVAPAVVQPFAVTATTPATGATDVPSAQVVSVSFSRPLAGTPKSTEMPTFNPPVAGTWVVSGRSTLTFQAAGPFVPSSTETLTVPAGAGGPHAVGGGTGGGAHGASAGVLPAPTTVTFTVAPGSTERLQQMLAQLNYLPLSFTSTVPAPAPAHVFDPQPGSFAWRWPSLPASLTSLWTEGSGNVITQGAVMNFQNQNGLSVDGVAGPQVWTTLANDLATSKANANPYDYVTVSKVLPENLTLYENGNPVVAGTPVNTGVTGADTADGTFAVFEHVTSSRMTGTNPDGSHYDDPNVPWASYFNGGDALHGFVRSSYGSPQSNGCVEMPIDVAGQIWPLTPIGTLVTVSGPAS